mmetsp:Transcript_5772/g.8175  ORF Transcript_5772/g.8175 Transcript_5772/m.8175 type:complete len:294 (+) Transcript_5772:136-1017(+)
MSHRASRVSALLGIKESNIEGGYDHLEVSNFIGDYNPSDEELDSSDEEEEEEDDFTFGRTFSQAVTTRMSSMAVGATSEAQQNEEMMQAAVAEKEKQEKIRKLNSNINALGDDVNAPFECELEPDDMRCLALVAHNHMKPAMKAFIETHSEILKKFRLTGTNTTMTMCKTVFGEDNPDVIYGPTCTSGPLGGDAQLAALMCLEDVGGVVFFMDPLSAHPHQADIDSLVRLSNVSNVVLCPNPTTGMAFMWMLRQSLIANKPEMFPSFFQTLESPAVADYKAGQKAALNKVVNS